MKVTGSCHCGAIAYEAEVDPNSVRVCHCTDCQRLTGTVFRAGISSLPGTFVLKRGTPKLYIKTAESGTRRAHAFRPECGTPIYSTSTEPNPQVYGLIYDDEGAELIAYGNSNWIMSQRRVEIPAGAGYALNRRIVVADGTGSSDPFALLAELYRNS